MTTETRERLLDAAEELFAEFGIDGTSLRTLTRRAGVNLAAVHYHFGSKDGLLDALVERRARPFNDLRVAELEQLEEQPGTMTVEAVVRAFLLPALLTGEEMGARRALMPRLLAQIHAQPRGLREALLRRHGGSVTARFLQALQTVLPRCPKHELADRFRLALCTISSVMSGHFELDTVPGHPGRLQRDDQVLEALIEFVASGLRGREVSR